MSREVDDRALWTTTKTSKFLVKTFYCVMIQRVLDSFKAMLVRNS